MLEALQVVGDDHDGPLGEVSVAKLKYMDAWLLGYWIPVTFLVISRNFNGSIFTNFLENEWPVRSHSHESILK